MDFGRLGLLCVALALSCAAGAAGADTTRTHPAAGVHVRVTRPPEGPRSPYMHARTAVADGKLAYLGSISLSPDSTSYDRGVGLILDDRAVVRKLQRQFDIDFRRNSHEY